MSLIITDPLLVEAPQQEAFQKDLPPEYHPGRFPELKDPLDLCRARTPDYQEVLSQEVYLVFDAFS